MEQKRYAQIMQDKCASLLADTQNCNYLYMAFSHSEMER